MPQIGSLGAAGLATLLVLAGAIPLLLAGPFVSAARLGILTRAQGMRSSLLQLTQINFAVGWYALIVPGHLAGGVIRWYRLARLENRATEALAAVVLSRISYLAVLAALGVLFLILDVGAAYGPVVLVGFVPLVLLVGLPAIARWPLWRSLGRRVGDNFLGQVLRAIGQYRHLSARQAAALTGLAALENLLGVAVVLLLAASIGVDVSFLALGWMRSVVQLLDALPLSILGLGVREASLLVLLEPYGIAGERALALAFLLLGRTLFLGLVGGLLEGIRVLAPGSAGRPEAAEDQASTGSALPSPSGRLGTPSA